MVIGADGLNLVLCCSDEAAFGASIEYFDNHFAWFGMPRDFDTLTQTFIDGPAGPLNVYYYCYVPGRSTFTVECDADAFEAYGFE